MATTLVRLIGSLPKYYGFIATAVKVFPELTFIKKQDQSAKDTHAAAVAKEVNDSIYPMRSEAVAL